MQPLPRAWAAPSNINTELQMLSSGIATCSSDTDLKGITSALFHADRVAICLGRLCQENTTLCALLCKSVQLLTVVMAVFCVALLEQFDITPVKEEENTWSPAKIKGKTPLLLWNNFIVFRNTPSPIPLTAQFYAYLLPAL